MYVNSDAVGAKAATVLTFAGNPIDCNPKLTHTSIHNNISQNGVRFATTNATNLQTQTQRSSTIICIWRGTPRTSPTSNTKRKKRYQDSTQRFSSLGSLLVNRLFVVLNKGLILESVWVSNVFISTSIYQILQILERASPKASQFALLTHLTRMNTDGVSLGWRR